MPLITVILFFIFVGLLFAFSNLLKRMRVLVSAKEYSDKQFSIELPAKSKISKGVKPVGFPKFATLSDAEAFFQLITPYIGSLSGGKRTALFEHIEGLKNDLKMDKAIYRYFIDEYKAYEGLSDEDAAAKWAGK